MHIYQLRTFFFCWLYWLLDQNEAGWMQRVYTKHQNVINVIFFYFGMGVPWLKCNHIIIMMRCNFVFDLFPSILWDAYELFPVLNGTLNESCTNGMVFVSLKRKNYKRINQAIFYNKPTFIEILNSINWIFVMRPWSFVVL